MGFMLQSSAGTKFELNSTLSLILTFNHTSAKLKDFSTRFRTHNSFVETVKAVKGRRDARGKRFALRLSEEMG